MPASSPATKRHVPGYARLRNTPADDADEPMIEPTERSMPPVMMTATMPIAMMPMKAKLRVML